MRSFASALIVAALATFGSAIPVSVPGGISHKGSSPSVPEHKPAKFSPAKGPSPKFPSSKTGSSGDVVKALEGETGRAGNGVHVRDAHKQITDAVKHIESHIHHARGDHPSVALVFADLLADVKPVVVELDALVAGDLSVDVVAKLLATVKVALNKALVEVDALVGVDLDVILAPAHGKGKLTVPQLAVLVGADVELIIKALGHILDLKVDVKVAADVKVLLVEVGALVGTLVKAVDGLVLGLDGSLTVLLKSVATIVAKLNIDLGLKL